MNQAASLQILGVFEFGRVYINIVEPWHHIPVVEAEAIGSIGFQVGVVPINRVILGLIGLFGDQRKVRHANTTNHTMVLFEVHPHLQYSGQLALVVPQLNLPLYGAILAQIVLSFPILDVPFSSPAQLCAVLLLQNESDVVVDKVQSVVEECLVPVGLFSVDQTSLPARVAVVRHSIGVDIIGADLDKDVLDEWRGTWLLGVKLLILRMVSIIVACSIFQTNSQLSMLFIQYNQSREHKNFRYKQLPHPPDSISAALDCPQATWTRRATNKNYQIRGVGLGILLPIMSSAVILVTLSIDCQIMFEVVRFKQLGKKTASAQLSSNYRIAYRLWFSAVLSELFKDVSFIGDSFSISFLLTKSSV